MLIEPKIRGFICTTAHPQGCKKNVENQIQTIKKRPPLHHFKNVLVIGASTGYGLSSRIMAAFGCGAATLGVIFEKPASEKRTATPGWYNTAAFETFAHEKNLYAKTINGDAFSDQCKQRVIELIKKDLGKIDLIIYSLASPRRADPDNSITYHSVLKTIGEPYTQKTIDVSTGNISTVTIEPANNDEINNTIKVMGGEDWERWLDYLAKENVLAENCVTVAYSYLGPQITYPMYRHGTIGRAKKHLEHTAHQLDKKLAAFNGHAYISVNKAIVTQASSAIPVVPLYASILYKVMKEKGLHENCIEQIYRLFSDNLCVSHPKNLDVYGLLRLDNLELRKDVQEDVTKIWGQLTQNTIESLTDLTGYREDFYQLFGFHVPEVDYTQETNHEIAIPSITDEEKNADCC
jgi:enoyl-[acyl-carrier protein] reductase/trans-2-enoyl-CoA reductase (NAD+)